MDSPEQVVELALGRHPEKALHGLVGLVEDAMRYVHGQSDQVAGSRRIVVPVDQEIEFSLEHVNELILGGMNMGRHGRAGWKGCMPTERALGELLGHVGLAENIPADSVEARAGSGDAR